MERDHGAVGTTSRPALAERLFGPLPFARQAHTHALSTAADTFFAVSLAGSLFFNVSVDAARPSIILYLAVTMAPFAVVAPIIGPVVDRVRGGHRLVIALTCVGRALVCLVLARHLKTLLFYPEALTVLVLGKTYSVAKSALVPRLVTDPEALVTANSRLSRIGTLSGAVGGGVAVSLLSVTSGAWTLRAAAVVYLAATVLASRIPRPEPAGPVAHSLEHHELHAPRVVLASMAMSVLRLAIGFFTFLLAFALKQEGEPAWVFGAVLAVGGAGGLLGTFVAPPLRRRLSEEHMLALALVVPAALSVVAALSFARLEIMVAALAIGAGANVGRQAFDSLLQHHAPDADRGRAFASFETRFQLAWVLGAMGPVVFLPSPWLGMLALTAILLVGAGALVAGLRAAASRGEPPHVRDLLAVTDEAPVAIHLLLTAEGLAGEGFHDQAILVAGAAADACPDGGADHAPARHDLTDLRRRAVVDSADMDEGDSGLAIALAAQVIAHARSN
ncbi:MAG TPA: MFS transporter [Acidimicrobiales bacterium]|nr:MFS transporter [Acidimicrobiales bacterium]